MLETLLTGLGYARSPTNGFFPFLLLTVVLGGAAAWRTGQAVAQVWGALWTVAAYIAVLALAVRFLHYALYGATLLSLPSYLVDVAILLIFAFLAHRVRRTRHMTEQYPWLCERSGPVSWRDRA